jgi:hypothetical protein
VDNLKRDRKKVGTNHEFKTQNTGNFTPGNTKNTLLYCTISVGSRRHMKSRE